MACQADTVALLHAFAEATAQADDAVALDVEMGGARSVAGFTFLFGKGASYNFV